MKIYRGLNVPIPLVRRAVAVGVFDGVHIAHARILKSAVDAARKNKWRSMAVTFFPHPHEALNRHQKRPSYLTSLEHRLEHFRRLGLDEAWVIRFDAHFAKIDADQFLEKTLMEKIGAACLSVGHDFCFGRNASGNVSYLRRRSKEMGFQLLVCPNVKRGGLAVSSTAIRSLIRQGRLRAASAMLGRTVSISGKVVSGAGRGRLMGFATANLEALDEVLPPDGVYAVIGRWNSKDHAGMLHIGKRPTFGEKTPTIEAHFFDWGGSLYGRHVELAVFDRIRPVRRFDTPKELSRMLHRDERRARKILYKKGFGRYNH